MLVDYEGVAGPGEMASPSRPIHPGEDDRQARSTRVAEYPLGY
jgi:hypothetical protein